MNITVSLTKMPTANIIAMATATLDRLQKARDEDYERKVVKRMEWDERSPWEMLTRKPKRFLSREEVDKMLRSRDYESYSAYSEYDWSQMRYGDQYDRAKRLLVLAKNAYDDHVYVTADDMWCIATEKPLV